MMQSDLMPGIIQHFLATSLDSLRCPDCDEPITADAMNIKEGVALCPTCGKLTRLSELNSSGRTIAEILAQPPRGCVVSSDGRSAKASVSLFSLLGFIFPAGFALFWNSIVSIFVLTVIAGLYSNFIGPVPNWFPAPGVKAGQPQMNGAPMDLGMTLFMCVFLTPFVLVGIMMPFIALMNLVGKVVVVIDEMESYVATGIGFLKWKKRFDPKEVQAVEFGANRWQSKETSSQLLVLKGSRVTRFGSFLDEEQQLWLRAVLKEILLPREGVPNRTKIPALHWLARR